VYSALLKSLAHSVGVKQLGSSATQAGRVDVRLSGFGREWTHDFDNDDCLQIGFRDQGPRLSLHSRIDGHSVPVFRLC
jgi:hypothetical protein